MAAIFQTTFSNGFLWMKMHKFRLKFHWSSFLGVQWTISGFYTKGRPLFKSNLICPSDKLSWQGKSYFMLSAGTSPCRAQCQRHLPPGGLRQKLRHQPSLRHCRQTTSQRCLPTTTREKVGTLTLVLPRDVCLSKFALPHCGLLMPYGDIDLGQHWSR